MANLTKILDCYLEPFTETPYRKPAPEEIEELESNLEAIFFFSLIWSIGSTVNLEGRRKFNLFLREQMEAKSSSVKIPEEESVYDFNYDTKEKTFHSWLDFNKGFEIDARHTFGDIVIPTKDYTRMLFLMKTLMINKKHVMCPGPVGTGKSLNCYTLLQTGLPDEFQYVPITFSA